MSDHVTRWILRFSAIGLWAAALTYLLLNTFSGLGLVLSAALFACGVAVWFRNVVAIVFLSLIFAAVGFLVPAVALDPLHAIQSGPASDVALRRIALALSVSAISLSIGVTLWSASSAVRRQHAPMSALQDHSWLLDKRIAIFVVAGWTILAVLLARRYLSTVHSVQSRTNRMSATSVVPPNKPLKLSVGRGRPPAA